MLPGDFLVVIRPQPAGWVSTHDRAVGDREAVPSITVGVRLTGSDAPGPNREGIVDRTLTTRHARVNREEQEEQRCVASLGGLALF